RLQTGESPRADSAERQYPVYQSDRSLRELQPGIPTYFCYAPRRGGWAEDGGGVGDLPWGDGKGPGGWTVRGVFACWGAAVELAGNGTSVPDQLGSSYRSVEWFVEWGLAHRELRGVEAIGVDEIHWGHGLRADNFLTVIYQIDAQCRRLLWVGRRRSQATLRRGVQGLGPGAVAGARGVGRGMGEAHLSSDAAPGRTTL